MYKMTSLLASTALLILPLATSAEEAEKKPAPISQQEVVEAALYGKVETIKKALAEGYKVDSRDPEKRTALMYAAFNGQTAIAKLLIEAGADVNAQDKIGTSSLMFAASAPGGTETVQLLLDSGAKINMIDNNEHFTALMWAAAEGQAEKVTLLLKHKADATLKDVDGDTAESFAAKAGHTAIAQLLKDATQEQKPVKIETEEAATAQPNI
jgi:ankyrin repeat protein